MEEIVEDIRVWKREGESTTVETSIEEVLSFLYEETLIECDTETTGLDPHINKLICIQFGNPDIQYLVEWKEELNSILSTTFKSIFIDKTKTFIFHNAAFDLKFLYKQGIIVSNVFDTFLAETVLTMGLLYPRRDLKSLLMKYLKVFVSKEIRKDIPKLGLISSTIEYGLDDVKYLTKLKEEQEKKIKDLELEKALSLENTFVKVLAYMEFIGIGFDKDLWQKNADNNKEKLEELVSKMDYYIVSNKLKKWYNYAGLFGFNSILYEGKSYETNINWSSPKQVAALFTELGFDVTIEDDNGEDKDSIGKEFLQKHEKDHELIGYFSKYVKIKKLLSSFGESYFEFINPVTGRIHTSYKQLVTTGRMSSGNKRNNAPNLQQVPSDEEFRRCFVSKPGHSLIASDYSGMESVIFANKTMDPGLLEFYDTGQKDMHSFVASKCFPDRLGGKSLSEIKENYPELRQDAKGAGFAIQFGGNGFTISQNLGIPIEVGEEVYNSYMKGFSGVSKYFEQVFEKTLEDKYVTFNDITKRKSFFDFIEEFEDLKEVIDKIDWKDYRRQKASDTYEYRNFYQPKVRKYFQLRGRIQRRSYNYPVQGSAADITKTALILIWNWIIENNYFGIVDICNVVHDEVIVECPDELAKEVSEVVYDSMVKAGAMFFKRVRLDASSEIGKYWKS